MELQQSPYYAKYIEALKWQVFTIDGVRMFYKKIPFIGGLLKIQRPARLPHTGKLLKIIQAYKVKTVAIEPVQKQNVASYKQWVTRIGKRSHVVRSGYLPTKTILINLKPSEVEIFKHFSEAKRRAVRKAEKNGVVVKESNNIKNLIHIKNKSSGFLGFITTFGIDKFWSFFGKKYSTIVLAYFQNALVGGVLVLVWHNTAYYWVAGATRHGKKLFAPTLLVWEAIKIAKKRGAKQFDFLGVWDERKPKEHLDWKGFTRFKEGFGGIHEYYPLC